MKKIGRYIAYVLEGTESLCVRRPNGSVDWRTRDSSGHCNALDEAKRIVESGGTGRHDPVVLPVYSKRCDASVSARRRGTEVAANNLAVVTAARLGYPD